MKLNANDIKKVAHLARLAVSDEDIQPLEHDLSNILTLVAKMNQADTRAVEPMAHPYEATQPLRNDVVTERDQHQLYQQIAPATQDGLYVVPKVIDNEKV